MDRLNAGHFATFFQAIHGHSPFPWQLRLTERVCKATWPEVLDLPTASGKTACLDVAVFAMAVRQCGPRRVFFVVDRRVVVDAAFDRMRKIAKALAEANGGVLKAIADRLREMGGSAEPLETYQMRGGVYCDDSWVRSPLQPALVASTVDQTGSRLLFRGYGVSDWTLPIHAGLVANDALILLDEAHCSRPFAATVQSVRRYRGDGWAEQPPATPFAFVQMTATPAGSEGERFGLEAEDYAHPELRKRLYAPKSVRLVSSKARLKDAPKFADDLVQEAERLAGKPGLRRIAVMVNRVQSARLCFEKLRRRGHRAHILIGRMRPIDRMSLPSDLDAMLSSKPRAEDGEAVFVVATQCLEVGADLDFDGVVTECAGVDALLQRFGRMDRIGDLWDKGTRAAGVVMICGAMADRKYLDPVYGQALANTWNWLKRRRTVDFGICSEDGGSTVRELLQISGEEGGGLRNRAAASPVLAPSHLDLLVQTSPRPALEPDVSLYLHGEKSGPAEVQVVWRADLDLGRTREWAEAVALCPPVSVEAMPVPYRVFLAWLTESSDEDASSPDLEGFDEFAKPDSAARLRCPVLRWRGDESEVVEETGDPGAIRPGDTLVLATTSGGWNDLGHVPEGAAIDVAEPARHTLRRGWVLRLVRTAVEQLWPETPARGAILELAGRSELGKQELVRALQEYRESLAGYSQPRWLLDTLEHLHPFEFESYPAGISTPAGWVLRGTVAEADAGADESSAASQVFLDEHVDDVAAVVRTNAAAVLPDAAIGRSLDLAAQLHDYGKVDLRFQALLRGGDVMAAQFAPRPLAKGARGRRSERLRSGLPEGFRHELLSLLFAQLHPEAADDPLALHLIASHHGRCRPFAPVIDDHGGSVAYSGLRVIGDSRVGRAAHRLDSGVAERFWNLTRCYGWWGLAYLEALLRLGDWQASHAELCASRAKEATT